MIDEDAVIAAADLIGRTGATGFEIGYLHEDVPADQAGWYATAQFRGARITADERRSPGEAAEALAVKILTGGKCKCGKLVALSGSGATAYGGTMADGTRWTYAEAARAGQCRWRRYGNRWQQGCEPLPGLTPEEPTP